MSLNRGKAKAKPSKKPAKKTTAATAGIPKRAVMNSRSPKKDVAISGDTTSSYAMYKKGGKVRKYEPGGEPKKSYADKIVDRIAKDDSLVGNYVIKPAAKALLTGVKNTGQAIKKYGPKIMEAGSKMEPGPKQKRGGTTRKYKSGGSFPDLTGDGKVTQADILKGRGVFKKRGSTKKKK